jgi:hypothetical protein
MSVWVVYGTTESGDDWRIIFRSKPSEEDLKSAIMEDDWLREEWDAECIQGWVICEETVREVA